MLAAGHTAHLATNILCSFGREMRLERSPESWGTSRLVASWRKNNYHERFGAYRELCLSPVWSMVIKKFCKNLCTEGALK